MDTPSDGVRFFDHRRSLVQKGVFAEDVDAEVWYDTHVLDNGTTYVSAERLLAIVDVSNLRAMQAAAANLDGDVGFAYVAALFCVRDNVARRSTIQNDDARRKCV